VQELTIDIKREFDRIISLAVNEEEREKIIAFINNENNNDFLEQVYCHSHGYYGWITLSSGKIVYISPPKVSAEETSKAFKLLMKRLNGTYNNSAQEEIYNLQDELKELAESFKELSSETEESTCSISDIKEQIKHSKNPLEVKRLNKLLNQMYKKKRK